LRSGTEQIQIAEQTFDEDLDRITLKLASPLASDSETKLKLRLRVPFKVPLTNRMIGKSKKIPTLSKTRYSYICIPSGYFYSQTLVDGEKVYVSQLDVDLQRTDEMRNAKREMRNAKFNGVKSLLTHAVSNASII
jgi:hypothetical protein